ncbi:PAS domain S-box protein [Thauera humireducens]|uniref:PAS domain-containing protein n=1 Tax=Thauera humireducens TaxID=1134435 RepID=UPI00311FEC91
MDKLQTFVSLFDYAPLPMSYSPLDAAGGLLASFWNRSWFECFGYRPDEVQGRAGEAFGPWPDVSFRADFLRAVGFDDISKTETTLRRADGSLRTVIVSARKMFADDTILMVVSYEDVTEQRQLESARKAAERSLRLFQEMVESSNDAIMIVEDHHVMACNTAATTLFAMPREQLIGRHPGDLSPERQDDGESSFTAAVRHMERALAGETEHCSGVICAATAAPSWRTWC